MGGPLLQSAARLARLCVRVRAALLPPVCRVPVCGSHSVVYLPATRGGQSPRRLLPPTLATALHRITGMKTSTLARRVPPGARVARHFTSRVASVCMVALAATVSSSYDYHTSTSLLPTAHAARELRNRDRRALKALQASTHPDTWKVRWPDLASNTAGDPCNDGWHGVTCDGEGYVLHLDLRANNLQGTIPSDLRQLERVQKLDLSANPRLYGSIPAELGQLTSLLELDLSSCQLDGTVPDSLNGLSNLEKFNVLDNKRLDGTVPSGIVEGEVLIAHQLPDGTADKDLASLGARHGGNKMVSPPTRSNTAHR